MTNQWKQLCRLLILLILVLNAASISAQTRVDSLKQKVARSKTTADRVDRLLELAIGFRQISTDSTFATLHRARQLATNENIDSSKIETWLGLAIYHNNNGIADSGLYYGGIAAKLSRERQLREKQSRAESAMGNGYLNKLDFQNAQIQYLKSLELDKQLGDKVRTGNTLVNIGYIFQQKGDTTTALKYFREAEQLFKESGDEERLAQVYLNFGILYGENNNFKASLDFFLKSTEIRERLDKPDQLPNNYLNVGGVYILLKQYDSARTWLEKAQKIFEAQNNQRGISNVLSNIGALEDARGNYRLAVDYFMKAYAIDSMIQDVDNLENLTVNISNAYQHMGDYKMAYHWDEKLLALKETIYKKHQSETMAEMQTKYETVEKERKIAIQENAIQRRNIIIGLIAGLSMFLAFAGLQYYKRYKLRQQAILKEEVIHQQDLASKAIIEAEERERKRIAGDLHDGLGQLFSAVRMNMKHLSEHIQFNDQQTATSFDKTMELVEESCKEVRSISHQMMPNTLLKFGLASAVRDFISKIDTSRLKVNLDIYGLNERLEANTETVLYRVLQEVVNNVIKHAAATQLDIQLSREDDGITATIEDNGKGFNKNSMDHKEGIGLKNIQSRVAFLKGNVEFDSTPGRGTVVNVWIPIPGIQPASS